MEENRQQSQSTITVFADASEAFHAMISRIRAAARDAASENPRIDRAQIESDVALALWEAEGEGKRLTPQFVEVKIRDAIFTARGQTGDASRSTRARVLAAVADARRELGREPTDEEVAERPGISLDAVFSVRQARVELDALDPEREVHLSVETSSERPETPRVYGEIGAEVQADACRLIRALEAGQTDREVLDRYGDRGHWEALLLELRMWTTATKDLAAVASPKEIERFTKTGFARRQLATMLGISESLVKKRVAQQDARLRAAYPERAAVAA